MGVELGTALKGSQVSGACKSEHSTHLVVKNKVEHLDILFVGLLQNVVIRLKGLV